MPSVQGMAEGSANFPSDLGAKLAAEAPEDAVLGGSSWRQELSINMESLGLAVSFKDSLPSPGKCLHPPCIPLRVKRSWPDVGESWLLLHIQVYSQVGIWTGHCTRVDICMPVHWPRVRA